MPVANRLQNLMANCDKGNCNTPACKATCCNSFSIKDAEFDAMVTGYFGAIIPMPYHQYAWDIQQKLLVKQADCRNDSIFISGDATHENSLDLNIVAHTAISSKFSKYSIPLFRELIAIGWDEFQFYKAINSVIDPTLKYTVVCRSIKHGKFAHWDLGTSWR